MCVFLCIDCSPSRCVKLYGTTALHVPVLRVILCYILRMNKPVMMMTMMTNAGNADKER